MLNVKLFHMKSFLPMPYEEALAPRLKIAHDKLQNGSGAGGDFTGWVHLPRDYDKEEFARSQGGRCPDPVQLPGVGGHRHRRILSGRPGRH